MENNRASAEFIHKATLKQTQEQHNKELLEKTKELKEVDTDYFILDANLWVKINLIYVCIYFL